MFSPLEATSLGNYFEDDLFDIVPMKIGYIILGRP